MTNATNTTIEAIEQELARLQAQIAELRAAEQAAKEKPKKTPWAVVDVENVGFEVNSTLCGGVLCDAWRAFERDYNTFASEDIAKGFANAFHVMIALRQCEGAGEVDDTNYGCVIQSDGDTDYWTRQAYFGFSLFPPFPSGELARAAANKVGRDKIAAAYKFLATGEV